MLTLKKVFDFGQDFSCKQQLSKNKCPNEFKTFPVSNNYQRISGQLSFTIEDKALIIIN
jgi:hypothetical protein